jgi:hypothetical protein
LEEAKLAEIRRVKPGTERWGECWAYPEFDGPKDRSKVIDLKELLPTQEGFRTFAVCAAVAKVPTQKWQIHPALVELRRGLLPDKSGHDSSTRSLETGQQVLN